MSYYLNEVQLNVVDFPTDGIQMAFSVVGDGLICEMCRVCLDVRVKDVLVQWSSAKVSVIYLLQEGIVLRCSDGLEDDLVSYW